MLKYWGNNITNAVQNRINVKWGWILSCPMPSILVLLFLLSSSLLLSLMASEAKKVSIGQGDIIALRLEIDEPTSVHELSFDAKRMQTHDPFSESYSRIPITVDIIDKGEMVGSESMTAHAKNKYHEISIDMNNDPKVGDAFNIDIKFDIPEEDGHDQQIRVDTDSIKVIDDKKNDLDIVRVSTGN
jgi:hypothetical protein